MTVSQEYKIAMNLIRKFWDTLRRIADCPDTECAKPLIESIKHPMMNALVQMKTGEGPLREEMIEPLTVIVSQMRELTNLEALKGAVNHLLSLADQAQKLEAEAQKESS
ncbi:MAG: hypothetical protein Q9N26_08660 [Aquificota bacterium]|nr:hypothetical protein [Aquificota bacterium]